MALDDLVFKHRDLEISLPKSFKNLFNEIKNSKYILDLKPYYDDESAKVPSYNVWRSTIEFIANYTKFIHNKYKIIIQAPKIYHGKEDSTDIIFRKPKKARMLINIGKKNKKTIVSYYGDNYCPKPKSENKKEKQSEIKGLIECGANKIHEPLVNWMRTYLRT